MVSVNILVEAIHYCFNIFVYVHVLCMVIIIIDYS